MNKRVYDFLLLIWLINVFSLFYYQIHLPFINYLLMVIENTTRLSTPFSCNLATSLQDWYLPTLSNMNLSRMWDLLWSLPSFPLLTSHSLTIFAFFHQVRPHSRPREFFRLSRLLHYSNTFTRVHHCCHDHYQDHSPIDDPNPQTRPHLILLYGHSPSRHLPLPQHHLSPLSLSRLCSKRKA